MAPRGSKSKKPSRGGGKHFSRGLRPLEDGDGFDGIIVPDGEGEAAAGTAWRDRRRSIDSESDESDNDGVELDRAASPPPPPPIAVANPNRAATTVPDGQLSRREREAMEAAAAKERYWKLHAEGKTDQAKADLARLAIIRKEREEKARQRKAEQDAKTAEQAARAQAQGRRK
ncbi:casein kinase substrate phosphoprotein PP28-domain-containing protein [Lipomyces kononenkoae]|uniref:Casein kinase substrate phosphoprotein PP28-domain-containing protein n=1 Tax=Lipomyces kononenkoae TaxID=34357 RepID=A0ACC3T5D6_LIPKO